MYLQRAARPFFGILFAILISEARIDATRNNFRNISSWRSLEFAFPSAEERARAIESKEFIPGSLLPIDVDVYQGTGFGRRIFVTIPRFQLGVPVTLGYLTNEMSAEGNPFIEPFPNWSWHRTGNCDAFTSVWRIQIDRCNRMWVLDAGKIEEEQVCPPQLLSFSMESYELLSRYKFPKAQYAESSLYVTPIVDARGNNCEDTHVYIADVTGFAIIVYDHQNTRSWKISNNLFYPYPDAGTFSISNEVFDLMDGILGMALSPLGHNGDRTLYFHSLASRVESHVATSVIRNFTLFHENPEASPRSFVAFRNKRSSQSAAEAMDRNGVMYFGLMSEIAIGCWNSRNYDYGDEFIERIAVDPETLQFASGMKVRTAKNGREELWVMTASFQRLMAGTLTPNETNFRIQAVYIDELVRGTKCDGTSLNINAIRHPGSHRPSGAVAFPQ